MTVKTDYKYIELTPQHVPIIAGTTLKVVELIAKKWTKPILNWNAALARFAIEFPDRFPL
ncbi:MAG: hypothetical protein ACO37W_01490 [Prochlorotrichaceae cyanobacterium]